MKDLIILATLVAGPKHGYQLKREAGFIFGGSALHNNLIYPLLHRFEAAGWVKKRAVPGERGQTRQQYAITPLGRKTLIDRIGQFDEQDCGSFPAFITRVGMFEMLRPKVRESILKRRADWLMRRDQQFAALQENMELGRYAGAVVGFSRSQVEFELKWIQGLRRLTKD